MRIGNIALVILAVAAITFVILGIVQSCQRLQETERVVIVREP